MIKIVFFAFLFIIGCKSGNQSTTFNTNNSPNNPPTSAVNEYLAVNNQLPNTVETYNSIVYSNTLQNNTVHMCENLEDFCIQLKAPVNNELKFFIKNPICLSQNQTYDFAMVIAQDNSQTSYATTQLMIIQNLDPVVYDLGYTNQQIYSLGNSSVLNPYVRSITCDNNKVHRFTSNPNAYLITNGKFVVYYNGTNMYVGFHSDQEANLQNAFSYSYDGYYHSVSGYFNLNAQTLYSTSYSDRYNQQLFSAIGSSRFVNVIENSQSSYSITSAISTYPNYNGINVNTVSQSHLAITGTVNNKHIIFGAFPKSGESTATVNSVLIRTPRKLGQLMLIFER